MHMTERLRAVVNRLQTYSPFVSSLNILYPFRLVELIKHTYVNIILFETLCGLSKAFDCVPHDGGTWPRPLNLSDTRPFSMVRGHQDLQLDRRPSLLNSSAFLFFAYINDLRVPSRWYQPTYRTSGAIRKI